MLKKILVAISIFLIILVTHELSSIDFGQKKTIQVVFRYDDYSAFSKTIVEKEIFDIFEKHNAPLTVGVIPFAVQNPYDPAAQELFSLLGDKLELLKSSVEKGKIEVAVHGYSHQANTENGKSEFAGLPISGQVELISAGKDYLQELLNTPIMTFVPPWNSYDQNTLKALEELGFSIISANKDGFAVEASSLIFLPYTCTLNEVRNGVLSARTSSTTNPILVVLFHSYDFIEADPNRGFTSLPELSDLMTFLSSQQDVQILSITEATQSIDDLSSDRFISAKNRSPLEILIESTLREEKVNDLLYRGGNTSLAAWIEVVTYYLLIAFVLSWLSFFLAKHLFKTKRNTLKIVSWVALAATILLGAYVFSDKFVFRMGMIMVMGSFSMTAGLFANLLLPIGPKSSAIIYHQ